VFADKDDIKQNVAQCIDLPSMYHLETKRKVRQSFGVQIKEVSIIEGHTHENAG